MRTNISKKDTSNLVRKALREAFPDIKFSVVASGSAMCSVLTVTWEDGANEDQVSAITKRFKAASFDNMDDSKNYIHHMMEGKEVSFYFDYIRCSRTNSDAAVQRAINQLYRRYTNNFAVSNVSKPTVEQFRSGSLMSKIIDGFPISDDVQRLIWKILSKNSDRLKVNHSPTAAKIFVTHDEGSAQRMHDALKNFESNILQ